MLENGKASRFGSRWTVSTEHSGPFSRKTLAPHPEVRMPGECCAAY